MDSLIQKEKLHLSMCPWFFCYCFIVLQLKDSQVLLSYFNLSSETNISFQVKNGMYCLQVDQDQNLAICKICPQVCSSPSPNQSRVGKQLQYYVNKMRSCLIHSLRWSSNICVLIAVLSTAGMFWIEVHCWHLKILSAFLKKYCLI